MLHLLILISVPITVVVQLTASIVRM